MALRVSALDTWGSALHGMPLDGVYDSIKLITAENYMGHFGKVGTIDQTARWRVDRQPSPATVSNLQIQRNGVQGRPSTVAMALVPNRYHAEVGGRDAPGYAARFSELTGAIQEALNRSVRSYRPLDPKTPGRPGSSVQAFTVTGDFSSPQKPFVSSHG